MAAPRLSVFTFESTVHPSHVLRRLEQQQRLGDSLCDVTVVVEGRSFRAHRCVLAACSSYFAQRLPSLSPQAAVLTLPPEVSLRFHSHGRRGSFQKSLMIRIEVKENMGIKRLTR